ncbi:MAG: BlaI/MecI/CopY family transcriptional regulator [Tepidisphaeraceae bacterium]
MADPIPLPTDAEAEILSILWTRGPSTVREVFETLSARRELAYTTVLKFLQIMTEKGLVQRDDAQRTHVYRAAYAEQKTQQRMLRDLLDRVFGGSKEKLLLQALAATETSPDELQALRKLLKKQESKGDRS